MPMQRQRSESPQTQTQAELSIFKNHGYDFLKVTIELIERLPLGVRARKTRNKTDEQSRSGTTLYYRRMNPLNQPPTFR
jgi:hypothetical protein